MTVESLKERITTYEEVTNTVLTRRLPIIIHLNGRSFRKVTSLLDKPFCEKFNMVMGQVLVKLAADIDGVVLGYNFNDDITLVCRNDQTLQTEAWYNNNIQKIVSITASIASTALLNVVKSHDFKLLGDPIFSANTFVVPSLAEAVNYLVAKQHAASHSAISMIWIYELMKNNDEFDDISKMTIEEKFDLLVNRFNIDLQKYPLAFWRGIACYRTPTLISDNQIKNKLHINYSLPFFSKEPQFLKNILNK